MNDTGRPGGCSPTGGRVLVALDKDGNVVDPLVDQMVTVASWERIPEGEGITYERPLALPFESPLRDIPLHQPILGQPDEDSADWTSGMLG